jgi:hypothetical protein
MSTTVLPIPPQLHAEKQFEREAFTFYRIGPTSISGCNHTQVYNRDVLVQALESRPAGVPLVTVANHHSCMDEPLLWGTSFHSSSKKEI